MILKSWLNVFSGQLQSHFERRSRMLRSSHTRHGRRRQWVQRFEQLEARTVPAATNPLPLSSLDGTIGFRMDGIDPNDQAGRSVSRAGDVNGDGFDDVIIGAPKGDPGGDSNAGEAYVVFGKASGFATSIDLNSLNGSNGFKLNGIDAGDEAGDSVSTAGDVNGDGFADLIVGAWVADPGGDSAGGEIYVVFGKGSGFSSSLELSSLNGTTGFRLDGIDPSDSAGRAVSSAGDINGDGFDDLVIGAPFAEQGVGTDGSGEAYVVFGKASGYTASFNLASLTGTNGFRLEGSSAGDNAGISVSSAGDVNGDGFDDLIVGARRADPGGRDDAGRAAVVYGKASGFDASFDFTDLVFPTIEKGYLFRGKFDYDFAGASVSTAGDVNGDGLEDIIIGAYGVDSGGDNYAGESYVVFGRSGGFSHESNTTFLSDLDGTDGFKILGTDPGDNVGSRVSGGGDLNGDGFDDLIIGVQGGEPQVGGYSQNGEIYVVFGKSTGFAADLSLNSLNGTNGFRIDGIDFQDYAGHSASHAGDINGDGFDDLIIGAILADPGGDSSAGEAYVVFGGKFTGGSETQTGTSTGETITANQGASATDILIGKQGADTVVSDGGLDVLYGGEGNDTLTVIDASFQRALGGTGLDTLKLSGSGINLDLTSIFDPILQDIEVLDISGSGENSLTLNRLEVLNLSSTSNTLLVRRSADDTVNQGDGWTQGTNETIDGATFEVFTQGAATLKVELPPVSNAPITVAVSSGKLVITDISDAAVDVAVTLDTGKSEYVVVSRTDGVATDTFRVAAATVTAGLSASLGTGDDKLDLSAISLNSTVAGGTGNDSLVGGSGIDSINGEDGNDTLTGGAGADIIAAGVGAADLLSDSTTTDLVLTATELRIGPAGSAPVDAISGFEKALFFGGGSANSMSAKDANIPVSIFAGGGNDSLVGSSLADNLDGQAGNDTLTSNAGNDTLNGAAGMDLFKEVAYTDSVAGQTRTITLASNSLVVRQGVTTLSADTLLGFEIADLTGGVMRDILNASGFTSSGVTSLSGGGGNDAITGTEGADLIFTLTGADLINGGGGGDSIFAGNGNDTIAGGAGADNLNGQNGDDSISGDADNDVLIGGAGVDSMAGGLGNDFLSGQTEAGLMSGGEGNDTLQGNTANDTLNGDAGDDRLYGLQGNDVVAGGDGADSLIGAAGTDSLSGGAGADTLQGDIGNDTIDGGADSDRINEVLDTNLTIVGITVSTTSFGTDTVTAVERIQVSGGPSANRFDARQATVPVFLAGDAGDDTLLGGSKADGITGGNGNDVLSGGGGVDILDGGAGTDVVYEVQDTNFTITGTQLSSAATGTETPLNVEGFVLIGGASNNKLDATASTLPVTLLGAAGNDTLLGGAQADVLVGGHRSNVAIGTDSLTGNAGSDIFDNDPNDQRDAGKADQVVANVFTVLPTWVDAI